VRLTASYLGVFLIVLAALSGVAYLFFARSAHEMLEPLLGLPEGQAAYAAALRRTVGTIVLLDLPLAAIVGIAAYILARVSVGPLVQAREREERFAADAAHELRTPLATIAAVAQAAANRDDDSRSRALKEITGVALDASALLADLLTLMRDAPDEARLHEPVDLGALIQAAVRDRTSHEAGVPVEITTPHSGAYVVGDERALRQMVRNLLGNALAHARRRIAVTVEAEARSIVLAIEDDGEGVPPELRERVFDRFFKARPDSPGSGLGLAICRHIAKRHGGTLTLEGRARFVVRLPCAEV
jgi:signal transduction histidine kinase